jgi:hypothetical protein
MTTIPVEDSLGHLLDVPIYAHGSIEEGRAIYGSDFGSTESGFMLFMHPIDVIRITVSDPIERLAKISAWRINDALKRFDERQKAREQALSDWVGWYVIGYADYCIERSRHSWL